MKDKIRVQINARTILVFAFTLIFAVSALLFVVRAIGYFKDTMTYKKVSQQVPSQNPESYFNQAQAVPASQTPAAENAAADSDIPAAGEPTPVAMPYAILQGNPADLDEIGMLRDYSKLKLVNGDLSGWIKVSGFKKPLSYPVMYNKDESYYLKKDFYNNASYAGSIFFDNRNDPSLVDRHIILYGHAMKDMAMFGFFADYPQNPEALKNVRMIYLDLLNTRLEYEIFSTYYARAEDPYRQTEFASDGEYLAFLERLEKKSACDFGAAALTPYDRILTLSTCSNSKFEDGRTVVHARLKRMIRYGKGQGSEAYAQSDMAGQKAPVSANVYLSGLSLYYSTVDITSPTTGSPAPAPSETSTPGTVEAPSPEPSFPAGASPSSSTVPGSQTASPGKEAQPLFPITIDPLFNASLKEYRASVPEEAVSLVIMAVPSDPKAVVEIYTGDEKLDTNAISLSYGDNTIKIRVISRDMQFARYITLTVSRPVPPAPQSNASPEPSPAVNP